MSGKGTENTGVSHPDNVAKVAQMAASAQGRRLPEPKRLNMGGQERAEIERRPMPARSPPPEHLVGDA
jgi:hypothetical protein